MRSRRDIEALAAVSGAVVVFGFGGVISKAVSTTGFVVAFWRLLLGSVAQVLLLAVAGRRLSWRGLRLSAVGGVLFGVHTAFFNTSLKLTSVANVTVIAALQPALVLVVAGRLLGERVRAAHVVWTAVAIAGVAAIVFAGAGTPSWRPLGDALAFCNLFAWTSYFLASKRVREEVGVLEYMAGVVVTAAVVMTALCLVTDQRPLAVDGTDWVWLVVLTLGPATCGHLMLTWAHPRVDASVSSLVMLGVPVVATVTAAVFLGERLTPVHVLGGTVVLVAIGAIVRGTSTPVAEEIAEGAAEAAAP